MQVKLVTSHEYGRQHCWVAVQSAPSVLGLLPHEPLSPPGVLGEGAAGATDDATGAVSSAECRSVPMCAKYDRA